MKLCQFCNEFACGQSGTKAISEYCGDKNRKIHCYVFSRSSEKAISKIDELTAHNWINIRYNRDRYCVETGNEIWEWIFPTADNIRKIKPIKIYIDKDLSICEEQYIILRSECAVEIHYF